MITFSRNKIVFAVNKAIHPLELPIRPLRDADRRRLEDVLRQFCSETDQLSFSIDEKNGLFVLRGVREAQLTSLVQNLRRDEGLDLTLDALRIAYLETITRTVEQDFTFKKHFGGGGQFARVKISLVPLKRDGGVEFANDVYGGAVPRDFMAFVERGVRTALLAGVVAGYPMTDLRVTLFDGAYHEVDSTPFAFETAGRNATVQGALKAGPRLLEPIIRVAIITPLEFVRIVAGDFDKRRGRILDRTVVDAKMTFVALAPLATLLGYDAALDSMTNGAAMWSSEFEGYDFAGGGTGEPPEFPSTRGMRIA